MVSLRFPFSFSQPSPKPPNSKSHFASRCITAACVVAVGGAIAVSATTKESILHSALAPGLNNCGWASLSLANGVASEVNSKAGASFGLKNIDVYAFGGFGSYLLGLNKRTYEQAGVDTPGNTSGSYKDPAFGWMAGFLFVSAFVGLLAPCLCPNAAHVFYDVSGLMGKLSLLWSSTSHKRSESPEAIKHYTSMEWDIRKINDFKLLIC
ncbi:hypothetical protein QQ045_024691 [Rhodiola kirilowii]